MLYYLLYHVLQKYFSPLNVFRYITVRTVYASLTAMFLALVFGPWLIRRLRELGATSMQLHRDAGSFAAKTGAIDWVVGVEGDAGQLIEAAASAGIPRDHLKFFSSSEDAANFLQSFLQSGDLLLVKGSRGVKMERIVEALLMQHGAPSAKPEASH